MAVIEQISQDLLDSIESLQANDGKGAKEEVEFIGDIISETIMDLEGSPENQEHNLYKLKRLNGIRAILKSFIPNTE